MNLKPLNDRILVQRTEGVAQSKGGIIIPDSAKEKPMEALVAAVGSGKLLKDGSRGAMPVADGDRVLFGKYSGDEVKIDGQDYLILRADDVLAVIED